MKGAGPAVFPKAISQNHPFEITSCYLTGAFVCRLTEGAATLAGGVVTRGGLVGGYLLAERFEQRWWEQARPDGVPFDLQAHAINVRETSLAAPCQRPRTKLQWLLTSSCVRNSLGGATARSKCESTANEAWLHASGGSSDGSGGGVT